MSKPKRATWWKMFYHQRPAIDSVSDADAGQGLKAAFRYFDGEKTDMHELSPGAFTVFSVMKGCIDEAISDYATKVENGRNSRSKNND